LRCDLLLPDNTLKTISACNGQFTYNGNDTDGTIKLWIRNNEQAPSDWQDKPSSSSVRTYPQWGYDFDNGEWTDSTSYNGSSSSSSNSDVDNFTITTDDSSPSTLSRVDLTVKARDSDNYTVTDYTNDVIFKVYYRNSSSSSRISTTSSSYFAISSSYSSDYNYGISFSSSRDGYHTFSNFIEFKKSLEYKVVVLDADDSSIK
jgi:hypothetical protein